MRFLINALSVTNTSGRHVLLGHLAGLAAETLGRHEFVVLWHPGSSGIVRELGPNVTWRRCPSVCRHWVGRAVWESIMLRRICRMERIGGAFTPAGMAMPVGSLPQIVFCQNPWALVSGLPRTVTDHVKGLIQRRSYREAVRRATVMVFNSRFMEEIYVANAGCRPAHSIIVHQGIDEHTFAAADRSDVDRVPGQIVSVSAMAPHKDVATLLLAMAVLRDRYRFAAQLKLVGIWPDLRYRQSMSRLVERLGLSDAVEFCGHVSREDLYRFYASATVFALLSRCESFGIPAVEAQAFGTPVVCANCCAAREIDGEGGVFVAPGDHDATAEALYQILTRKEYRQELSARAKANAARFRWASCTRPLLPAFERIGVA